MPYSRKKHHAVYSDHGGKNPAHPHAEKNCMRNKIAQPPQKSIVTKTPHEYIRVTYKYIQVHTSNIRVHTSTYEQHTSNIRVHTSTYGQNTSISALFSNFY